MKFAKLSVRHLHVLLSITVLLCGSHASAQALNRPPSDRDILPQACFAPDSIICSYALVRQVSNGRPTRTICLIEECDCYSPQGQLTGVEVVGLSCGVIKNPISEIRTAGEFIHRFLARYRSEFSPTVWYHVTILRSLALLGLCNPCPKGMPMRPTNVDG